MMMTKQLTVLLGWVAAILALWLILSFQGFSPLLLAALTLLGALPLFGSLWLRRSAPRSMADVIDGIESEEIPAAAGSAEFPKRRPRLL
jgi:hypothetical protein